MFNASSSVVIIFGITTRNSLSQSKFMKVSTVFVELVSQVMHHVYRESGGRLFLVDMCHCCWCFAGCNDDKPAFFVLLFFSARVLLSCSILFTGFNLFTLIIIAHTLTDM